MVYHLIVDYFPIFPQVFCSLLIRFSEQTKMNQIDDDSNIGKLFVVFGAILHTFQKLSIKYTILEEEKITSNK